MQVNTINFLSRIYVILYKNLIEYRLIKKSSLCYEKDFADFFDSRKLFEKLFKKMSELIRNLTN